MVLLVPNLSCVPYTYIICVTFGYTDNEHIDQIEYQIYSLSNGIIVDGNNGLIPSILYIMLHLADHCIQYTKHYHVRLPLQTRDSERLAQLSMLSILELAYTASTGWYKNKQQTQRGQH